MRAHTASLIHAIVLMVMSGWAFMSSDSPSVTALIPAFFGIVFIALYPGVKAENKIVAHIAAVLTLVVLIALFMPLRGAINREEIVSIIRVSAMLAATVFAMVFFVKSFIDVRRARREAGGTVEPKARS